MHWKPDAGLPARGLEVHFGMDGTSISRGQKQQSCGKSAKPTGLRPEPGTYGESSSKMQWKPDAGLPARELLIPTSYISYIKIKLQKIIIATYKSMIPYAA